MSRKSQKWEDEEHAHDEWTHEQWEHHDEHHGEWTQEEWDAWEAQQHGADGQRNARRGTAVEAINGDGGVDGPTPSATGRRSTRRGTAVKAIDGDGGVDGPITAGRWSTRRGTAVEHHDEWTQEEWDAWEAQHHGADGQRNARRGTAVEAIDGDGGVDGPTHSATGRRSTRRGTAVEAIDGDGGVGGPIHSAAGWRSAKRIKAVGAISGDGEVDGPTHSAAGRRSSRRRTKHEAIDEGGRGEEPNSGASSSIIFVTICSAQNLRDADTFGKSDPFCVCEAGKGAKFKTPTKSGTLNPEWNFRHEIDYSGEELTFAVWDDDTRDDLLGRASLAPEDFAEKGFDGELELSDPKRKKGRKAATLRIRVELTGGRGEESDSGAVRPGAPRRGTHAMIEKMQQEIEELKSGLKSTAPQEQDYWDKESYEAHVEENMEEEELPARKKKKKKKKKRDKPDEQQVETVQTGPKWEQDTASEHSRIISSVSSDDEEKKAARHQVWEAGKLMRRNIRQHMLTINNTIPAEDYSSATDASSNSDVDRLFSKLSGKRVLPRKKRKKKKKKKRPEDDSEQEDDSANDWMKRSQEEEEEDDWAKRAQEQEEEEDGDSWLVGDAEELEDEAAAREDKRRAREADPGLDDAMQRRAIQADTGEITRVRVTIIRARGVITGARKDDVAVYCACQLKGKEQSFTTPTMLSTYAPDWNYTHKLHGYSEADTLVFRLWDATRYGDDFLGRGKLRPADLIEGFDGEITLTGTEEEGVRATLQVKVELLDGDEDTEDLENEEVAQAPWEMPEDKLRASAFEDDEEEEGIFEKTMPRTASGFLTGGVPKIRIQILSAIMVPGALQVSNSALYCTCTNRNKSGSWFQTHVCYETDQPVWNYEQNLALYDPKDVFQFKLFEKDESGEKLLGKAKLGPEQIVPDGFDGELEMGRGHPTLLRVKVQHLMPLQEDEAEVVAEEVAPESALWHAGALGENWERELANEQKELRGRQAQDAELDKWKGFEHVSPGEALHCKLSIISALIDMQGDEIGNQFLRVAGGVKDKPETDFTTEDRSDTWNPEWRHDIILSDVDRSDTLRLNFMEGGEVVARKKVKFEKLTSPEFEGQIELTSLAWGVRVFLNLGIEWVSSDEVEERIKVAQERVEEVSTELAQMHGTELEHMHAEPMCKIFVNSALIEQIGQEMIVFQSLSVAGDVRGEWKTKTEFMTNVVSEDTRNPVWDHEVALPVALQEDTVRLNLMDGNEVVARTKIKLAELTSPDFEDLDSQLELISLFEGVRVVLSVGIEWHISEETQADEEAVGEHSIAGDPEKPTLKVTVLSADGLKKVPDEMSKEAPEGLDSPEVQGLVAEREALMHMKQKAIADDDFEAAGMVQKDLKNLEARLEQLGVAPPAAEAVAGDIDSFKRGDAVVATRDLRARGGVAVRLGTRGSVLGPTKTGRICVRFDHREDRSDSRLNCRPFEISHVPAGDDEAGATKESKKKKKKKEKDPESNKEEEQTIKERDPDAFVQCMVKGREETLISVNNVGMYTSAPVWMRAAMEISRFSDKDSLIFLVKDGGPGADPKDARYDLGSAALPGQDVPQQGFKGALTLADDGQPEHAHLEVEVEWLVLPLRFRTKHAMQKVASMRPFAAMAKPVVPNTEQVDVHLTVVGADIADAHNQTSLLDLHVDVYLDMDDRAKTQTDGIDSTEKPLWHHEHDILAAEKTSSLMVVLLAGKTRIGKASLPIVVPADFDGKLELECFKPDVKATVTLYIELSGHYGGGGEEPNSGDDFVTHHEEASSSLIFVTICSAQNLRDADTFGKSDPFCVCATGNGALFQTPVISNTLNPEWNFRHEIDYPGGELTFAVWDDDMMDDLLGSAFLAPEAFAEKGFSGELELSDPKRKEGDKAATLRVRVDLTGDDREQGAVAPIVRPKQVTMRGDDDEQGAVAPIVRPIQVTVVRANGLLNLDTSNKWGWRKKKDLSDPFVTCAVKGKEEATEVRSSAMNNDLNPEFNFETVMEHFQEDDSLIVALYDDDDGVAELLGSTMLTPMDIFPSGGFDGRMALSGTDQEESGTVDIIVKLLDESASDKAADVSDMATGLPVGQATGIPDAVSGVPDKATRISDMATGLPDWFIKAPIRLTIVGAQKLHDTDGGKKDNHSDPYCMCQIRGQKKTRFQTGVKKDTLDPVWNHAVQLEAFGRNDMLDFKVCDEAWGRDEIIGEGSLSALQVFPKGFDGDVVLKRKKKDEGATLQVVVEVLQDIDSTHMVKVICAEGLIDLDSFGSGKSDPYCVLEIEGKSAKYQTRVIKDNLNPVWNHKILTADYRPGDTLKFSVWDQDPKDDAPLGVAFLSAQELEPDGGFDGQLTLRSDKGAHESMGKLKVQVRHLIADANKKPVTLRSMEVKIVSAANIRNAKYGVEGQGSQPYCTCELRGGKEDSRFRTPPHENAVNPVWNYASVLPLCVSTDRMIFNVWDLDETGTKEIGLGTAELELAPYVEHGFKGDLQLTGSGMRFPPLLKVELTSLDTPALQVCVMGAYGLHGESKRGFQLPDGLCVCTIKGKTEPEFKTKTINNSNNPRWEHTAVISKWSVEDEFVFTVWDKDIIGKTFLGSTSLKPILYPHGFDGHLELAGSDEPFLPSLEISMSFVVKPGELVVEEASKIGSTKRSNTKKRAIFVTIYSAQNLRDADTFGKSDPYCICEAGNGAKFQTPVISETLNPEWNFRHEIDYSGEKLTFAVWDDDVMDDLLGRASLGPEAFAEKGFSGELELSDPKRKKGRKAATLRVRVDLTEAPEEEKLQEGPSTRDVTVKILGAKGLLKEKDAAVLEPFVRCEIKGKPAQKFQTQGIQGMQDPSWNYERELKEYDIEDTFIFTVWDRDAPDQNLIGHAMLRPKDLYPEGRFKGELKLSGSSQKRTATLHVAVDVSIKDELPELEEEVKVEEQVPRRQQVPEESLEIKGLSVYIQSGNRLGYSDAAAVPHKSDPYCSCELKFKPDTYNKTPVARGTLDPMWHYACRIENYEPEDTLLFSVWDKFVQGQDFLGKAVLTKEYLWPKGFAGDVTLHDDMHREAGTLKVMVKILRGARQARDMHKSFVSHFKTSGQQKTETQSKASSGSLGLPGKQYPVPNRAEARIDPQTKKSYRWPEFKREFQGKMSLEELMAYWFESMTFEDHKGLPAIKLAIGNSNAQTITQIVSVHPVADDSYICKPKITMDTKVLYTGPTDEDIVVKVFRGIPEGPMGIACKRFEYVGFVHAMQGGERGVTVESQGSKAYFLCLEIRRYLNQASLGGHSLREQQAWAQGVCNVKEDISLLERQADRADFLACLADSGSPSNVVLLRRLVGPGPKSGPWGNFREPQRLCTDFSIGLGKHTGPIVELMVGPCRFGRSFTRDDEWFREYGQAAKQTTYGVLVIMPSKEFVTSDIIKVVLGHIPEERKFVYDHRFDCIICLAEYFHRITGSGPAIIRAAASGDMAAIQVFLTTDPSAPSALLAADGAGNTPLHQAALFGHCDLCELLLDAKASPNIADHLGFTPLYQAAVHGQKEIVDLLLAARGNVDLPNVMGQPMLEVAAQRGYRSVVLRLRDAGAPEYYKEEPSQISWKNRVGDRLRSAPTRW